MFAFEEMRTRLSHHERILEKPVTALAALTPGTPIADVRLFASENDHSIFMPSSWLT